MKYLNRQFNNPQTETSSIVYAEKGSKLEFIKKLKTGDKKGLDGVKKESTNVKPSQDTAAKTSYLKKGQKGTTIVKKDNNASQIPSKNLKAGDTNTLDKQLGINPNVGTTKETTQAKKPVLLVKKSNGTTTKKKEGGYLKKVEEDKCGGKMKAKKGAHGMAVEVGKTKEYKRTEVIKKGAKAKKCLKGCGCGTKLHKNGGVISTVCSCCGGFCS